MSVINSSSFWRIPAIRVTDGGCSSQQQSGWGWMCDTTSYSHYSLCETNKIQRWDQPLRLVSTPDLHHPVWLRRIRGLFQVNTGRDVAQAHLLLGRQEGATKQRGNFTDNNFTLDESKRVSLLSGNNCAHVSLLNAPVTHSYGKAKLFHSCCSYSNEFLSAKSHFYPLKWSIHTSD